MNGDRIAVNSTFKAGEENSGEFFKELSESLSTRY